MLWLPKAAFNDAMVGWRIVSIFVDLWHPMDEPI
jgi:hypothetical protein